MQRSIYRIIDANFNRTREAARVLEEYCRFHLNSASLSGRAKQLRHKLCAAINKLDTNTLIASRNAVDDVGFGLTVDSQLKRKNIDDCFAAAAKRLTEALRALEEAAKTLDPDIAQSLEQLRFCAYTLEKDVSLASRTYAKFASVSLYVLITINDSHDSGYVADMVKKCAAGGADCIQLRAKALSDSTLFAIASDFVKACTDQGVVSIINDRIDIAALTGADGVHLGQNDLTIQQARKIQLSPLILGLSTHSMDQLKTAMDQRPDYIALGPVFDTNTKPHEKTVGLEYVSAALPKLADTGIYHVAIGGIDLENIDQVIKAGAKTIAVCSAVTGSQNPSLICRKLKDKLL